MGRANKLTAKQVQNAKEPGIYGDGGGLALRVTATGGKSWIFRWMRDGKAHMCGLGPLDMVTLAEAREKAFEMRRKVFNGVDPIAERRTQEVKRKATTGKTFDVCAKAYIAAQRAGWKNAKHAAQWESTLKTYASSVIGSMDVALIDTPEVLDILRPIWTAKAETANRLRGRIEKILDYAKVSGYRTGENPARWQGHLDHLLASRAAAKRSHEPALPYTRMAEFMRDLRAREGMAAKALELVILTASRSGEVRGATWSEFDLEAKVWTIPAERMKMKKPHYIPLAPRAVELIEDMKKIRRGSIVFYPPRGDDKPLSDMTLTALLQQMHEDRLKVDNVGWIDPHEDNRRITAHGFRSSFRDWAGETTAHPREVIEHALAHQLADKAEAAYQRGTLFDKRRALMADWAAHINAEIK